MTGVAAKHRECACKCGLAELVYYGGFSMWHRIRTVVVEALAVGLWVWRTWERLLTQLRSCRLYGQ